MLVRAIAGTTGRDARRGPVLVLSAFLTALGIAILNFDSQSIATLLLVAGAGLAASLILLSGQSPTDAARASSQNAISSRSAAPAQFTELLAQPQSNLDRAVWAKLTAHMSHELRTPLNAVLGFSELMSKEVFGPLGSSTYGDYARDIHASGRMLLKSAEDALAITALLTAPSRRMQSCHLKTIMDDVRGFAQCDLDARSITIETLVDADIEVIGDAQAIRQMLINLITEASRNACAGTVVRAEVHRADDLVALSITLSGQESCEASIDDGFGMILARTLCELSNAQLCETKMPEGKQSWTVRFLAPTQNDLFRESA
jgi:two-component system cell cycle sensor histidine kinase PleC